jgi:hypothetical protein
VQEERAAPICSGDVLIAEGSSFGDGVPRRPATALYRSCTQRLGLAAANALHPGFQIAGRKEVDDAIGSNLGKAGGR